jgi:hypothetical protein
MSRRNKAKVKDGPRTAYMRKMGIGAKDGTVEEDVGSEAVSDGLPEDVCDPVGEEDVSEAIETL